MFTIKNGHKQLLLLCCIRVAINEREKKTIDILLSVLANKLLNQGFLLVKLKSFQKFYCHHHNLINCITEYLCHKSPQICSVSRNHNTYGPYLIHDQVCNKTVAACGAGIAYPSGASDFTPFLVDSCYSIFSFV
jgi:hypothetical protein